MNDIEFWPEIKLRPIGASIRSPLRRTLARTAWQRSPLASICYESVQDKVLIKLVDAPTVAEAIPSDSDGQDLSRGKMPAREEGGQFAGFDGTEPYAWPTMIAVLGFSRCQDSDAPRIQLVRELCGDHVWTAARSAAHAPQGALLEVPLGQDEAEFLIRRWGAILTLPSATGMTGPRTHAASAGEFSTDSGPMIGRAYWSGDRATILHGTAGHRGGEDREP